MTIDDRTPARCVFYDSVSGAILGAVRGRWSNSYGALIVLGLTLASYRLAAAADATADSAAHLSDSAFNLLNSINAKGGSNPLADPVANFAADAQTLSQELASGDRAGAAAQMATLLSDRGAVDRAIKGSGDNPAWDEVAHQLDALAKAVPPSLTKPSPMRASASAAIAAGAGEGSDASAPMAPVSKPVASAPERIGPMPAMSSADAPPKAVIESRDESSGMLRIKGYLEGTALARAGIYQNGQLLKPIQLKTVHGEQRLDFDIGLGSPEPGMSIRVYDSNGRSAEAFASAEVGAPNPGSGNTSATESGVEVERSHPPNPGSDNTSASEEGVEVDRAHPAAAAPDADVAVGTAEIPSHGHTRPSPSKRHTMESHLGDVQIDVVAIRQIAVTPPMYEVLGVIQGRDVTRAGIYIDGRLAARIPTSASDSSNNLDQRFVMDGSAASIRAFGVGNHFVEQPIDLSTAVAAAAAPEINPALTAPSMMMGGSSMTGAPANAVPGTIAIQISTITNLSPGRTVVKGVISGRNVSAAGLYQNGRLDQSIAVSSGGGLLGSVLAHFGTQNVPFIAYFNPANGPAVIRATDSTGAYTEEPVALGGVSEYMNPPPVVNNVGTGGLGTSPW
jgi:hypothetical protein